MKTFLKIFIPLLLVGGASWYIYQENFGGEDYYTQIITSGTKEETKSDAGEKLTRYNYTQKAYNQQGKEKTEELSETREKPLRMNAYLKLKVNKNKGVLSWVEVKEKEVPAKAMEKLNKTLKNKKAEQK